MRAFQEDAAVDKPKIVNLNELPEPRAHEQGEKYSARLVPIGAPLGAKKLGYNLTEIQPGKRAFPYHFHHVNEEMFLVLEGTGELRWPGGTHPLRPMDIVCCPPGPECAHQIINTGKVALRYLALSTTEDPEVVEYPDSGKYAVTVGRPVGGNMADAKLRVVAFKKDGVDYWAGE
jgi:uncharacterized cupin superfamily protein